MKPIRVHRKSFLFLFSVVLISCGLFRQAEEITNLQSTIDALTSPQDTDEIDSDEIDIEEPPPPITTENLTQATPEQKPTETTWHNALTYIGQYGGSTNTIAINGQYAYMGQGPRIVVLDISNPEIPVFVSESELLPGLVQGVKVEGDYVYATTLFSGLHILDISQATNPKIISNVEPEQPSCGPLTLKAGIAFIACNPSGLFIVDVNNPTAPEVLSSGNFRGTLVSIALDNDVIYLADITKGVNIIDVSDPKNPRQIGFFDSQTIPSLTPQVSIEAVDMCQGDLCLAVGNHGFVILDLTDQGNPTIKASVTQFWPSGLTSQGEFAFLVDDLEGVRVFNISDPTLPQQVGLMPTSVGGFEFSPHELKQREITIADQILYIPDPAYGLTTVDIRNPSQPVRVGHYMTPVPDAVFNIKVVGNHAFTANRNAGFRVVDVSNPENMFEIFYDDERKDLSPYLPTGLEIVGNYAYISDGNFPLHVYDITNPNQPIEVAGINSERSWDGADNLVISGNFAYLSGRGGNTAIFPGEGIWVIDISNPSAPDPVHFIDLPNSHWSLAIYNNILFALDGQQNYQEPDPISLRIIDISNPMGAVPIKSIAIPELNPGSPRSLMVSGDWLYLGIGLTGIKLFDIRDPYNPIETSVSSDSGIMPTPFRFAHQDNHLLVNGTMLYDISEPEYLRLIGLGVMNMHAWDGYILRDLVYVATSFQGIYVYQITTTP